LYVPVHNSITNTTDSRPDTGQKKPAHIRNIVTLPLEPGKNSSSSEEQQNPGHTVIIHYKFASNNASISEIIT